jgi:hypothetical protein
MTGGNRVIETDSSGRTLHVVAVPGAEGVEALRNGHFLVWTETNHLVEVDRQGHTLWEIRDGSSIYRVRSVLDKVRIGFDKPWPSAAERKVIAREVGGLNHPYAEARKGAAVALGELRPTDDASLRALCAALDDDAANVRGAAAGALALIGEVAVAAVQRVLTTGTLRSRLAAASALEQMDEAARTAVPVLGELVRDETQVTELRIAAARALGAVGPEAQAAVAALLVALVSERDDLREAAASNVVKLTWNDPKVLDALGVALMDRDHPRGQLAAATALLVFDPKAIQVVAPASIELLKTPADHQLVSKVVALLRRAEEAGGDVKPAVPVLLELLKDAKQSDEVRLQIVGLAGRLADPTQSALLVFSQVLREPRISRNLAEFLIEHLAEMGEGGMVELGRAVNEGALNAVYEVFKKFRGLDKAARPALPELRKALRHPNEEVRNMATAAIKAITGAEDDDLPDAEVEVVP